MTELYLLRHGQTDYNVQRLFYGTSDVAINHVGKQQAQRLHQLLSPIQIDAIYTSALIRTQQTADIIFPKQTFIALEQFNEKGFGLWEGMDADTIQANFPLQWQAWLDAPFDYTPMQAEDFRTFKQRVILALTSILAKHTASERVAIVAHLGVLRIIYQHLIDVSADFWQIDFPQGEVTIFKCDGQNWQIRKG